MQVDVMNGRQTWSLWNKTTAGENFCEKWKRIRGAPQRSFPGTPRRYSISKHLPRLKAWTRCGGDFGSIFGAAPATKAMDALTERVNRARSDNHLSVSRPAGLIAGTVVGATPVRANTFFGADC